MAGFPGSRRNISGLWPSRGPWSAAASLAHRIPFDLAGFPKIPVVGGAKPANSRCRRCGGASGNCPRARPSNPIGSGSGPEWVRPRPRPKGTSAPIAEGSGRRVSLLMVHHAASRTARPGPESKTATPHDGDGVVFRGHLRASDIRVSASASGRKGGPAPGGQALTVPRDDVSRTMPGAHPLHRLDRRGTPGSGLEPHRDIGSCPASAWRLRSAPRLQPGPARAPNARG
jgi:hypothetical protein